MSAAEDLLERMQRSKADWTPKDLETLYLGFGFTQRDSGKHTVYTHPIYRHLRATVTRAHDMPIGYVQTAIRLIRQLRELERAAAEQQREP